MANSTVVSTNLSKDNCTYAFDTGPRKFLMVACVGTPICALGILSNALLLSVLLKRSLRNTYLTYLAMLAVLDMGILATYVALFSVKQLKEQHQWLLAHVAWVHYCGPLFFVSRVT